MTQIFATFTAGQIDNGLGHLLNGAPALIAQSASVVLNSGVNAVLGSAASQTKVNIPALATHAFGNIAAEGMAGTVQAAYSNRQKAERATVLNPRYAYAGQNHTPAQRSVKQQSYTPFREWSEESSGARQRTASILESSYVSHVPHTDNYKKAGQESVRSRARNSSVLWNASDEYYAAGRAAALSNKSMPNLNHLAPYQQARYAEGYSSAVDIKLASDIVDGIAVITGITELAGMVKSGAQQFMSGRFWTITKESKGILNAGGRKIISAKAALKADQEATEFYDLIRNTNSKNDIRQISKNTGIPEYRLERIKNHVFMENHRLAAGRVDKFDPYIEISDAWTRLRLNNFYKQDIDLLHHEYFESKFERLFKTDYDTAHRAAENSGRKWNPEVLEEINNSHNWRK